jgi:hypothetical protein
VIWWIVVALVWAIGAWLLRERDKRAITKRVREELTRQAREEHKHWIEERERKQEEFVAKTASGHWPRHWPRGDA